MRRRRTIAAAPVLQGVNAAPPEFAEWFAGKRPMPVSALIEPFFHMLPHIWADYVRRKPGARPPADAPEGSRAVMFGIATKARRSKSGGNH